MGTVEWNCLMICITIIVVVLICVVGKCCRQCRQLKHEKEMESMKWAQKMLWEDKRTEILNKKE